MLFGGKVYCISLRARGGGVRMTEQLGFIASLVAEALTPRPINAQRLIAHFGLIGWGATPLMLDQKCDPETQTKRNLQRRQPCRF